MHYRVNGWVVRAERTAKPRSQASGALKRWILEEKNRGDVLDFGCGRLRYAHELSMVAETLTFVDSQEQLRRTCTFESRRETVAEHAVRLCPKARTLDCQAFIADDQRYDFILCANVLSSVPVRRERQRIMRLLASRLKASGRCLFVTQYRNSYYRELEHHPGATRHLDGLLVNRGSTSTFYGLVRKNSIIRLARLNGLQTERAWTEGQSAYVLCIPD